MPKPLIFKDFTGGLNTNEPTLLASNELAKAQNVYYDDSDRLSSRAGIQNFKEPIPDAVTVLASMNTFNGDGTWTGSGDAGTVATDATDKQYDAGSVSFTVTVTGTSAILTNTGITSVDLTTEKETGYFTIWANFPVVTDLTSVTLTLGNTLDSQDYELAVTTNADGGAFATRWNLLKFTWADMTATGSPDGTIDEIRLTLTYDGAYAGGANFNFDQIIWNSPTTTKAAHSGFHVKLTDSTLVTLVAAGTMVFRLVGDYWNMITSGYTDGLKFSFLNYLDIIYFSNGTDNYSYYNPAFASAAGSIVTEDASAPKAKYLMMVASTAYAGGIKDSLNELKYSTAVPANLLNAVWTGSEKIYDDDSREEMTGIGKLPNDAVAVFLENSAYYVDTIPSTTVIRPLDYDGGCQSFRTIVRVKDDMFFLAEDAVYSLNQRQGTTGTFGSSSLSDKVQTLITTGSDLTTASAFRGKRVKPNHYYLALDTTKSGTPDTCLVYNTKIGKAGDGWTEYTNISSNQFLEVEDADGNWHLIYLNAFSGQVREMEVNLDDNGVEIPVKVWTGINDFGDPTLFKMANFVDINGFLTETAQIQATDELDGEINTTDIIDGTNFSASPVSVPLGVSTLGLYALTAGVEVSEMNLYNVRKNIYQSLNRFQLKLESETLYSQWILSKIQFNIEALPVDFFPENSYI